MLPKEGVDSIVVREGKGDNNPVPRHNSEFSLKCTTKTNIFVFHGNVPLLTVTDDKWGRGEVEKAIKVTKTIRCEL